MLDVTPLQTAVDALADRLRALPQSALRRGAAAEGLALARELTARAQRIERPGERPRELPDAGMFAVGDQLAVAGHDLVEALRAAAGAPEGGAAEADVKAAPAEQLAEAVRRVREAAQSEAMTRSARM
ncbi:hypothetical protein ACH4YO_26890 [Streptomyces noursei]|uniref:hypothetical protein n=1 Tax=Streptomyces noursei TaxID=1971 RepID=UPI00081D2119|nr:hypothetical protein [Streptomyces noursei]ANZ18257.1 hypothetical protein SNOUR_24960 [Streptomyces noursei ATCC 11455]MCZ1016204.1 hypothetical protein [Streptomyces noursei]GGX01459.1 hypothetical protein GCM10010341_24100 [Streptomyces noursei]